MRVDICCIARNEGMTIHDWIEYHYRLGINHIHIYDNNDNGDDSLEWFIAPYIRSGFVTIYDDFKGYDRPFQNDAYRRFITKNNEENLCDWCFYIDCDEYLTIRNDCNDITEFMEKWDENCPDGMIMYTNWECYTCGNNILYDPAPVTERFVEKIANKAINRHVKSAVKYGCDARMQTPHNAVPSNREHKIYTSEYSPCPISPFQSNEGNHQLVLRHYVTKSIQEFAFRKMRGRRADAVLKDPYNIEFFLNHQNDMKFPKEIFDKYGNILKYGR